MLQRRATVPNHLLDQRLEVRPHPDLVNRWKTRFPQVDNRSYQQSLSDYKRTGKVSDVAVGGAILRVPTKKDGSVNLAAMKRGAQPYSVVDFIEDVNNHVEMPDTLAKTQRYDADGTLRTRYHALVDISPLHDMGVRAIEMTTPLGRLPGHTPLYVGELPHKPGSLHLTTPYIQAITEPKDQLRTTSTNLVELVMDEDGQVLSVQPRLPDDQLRTLPRSIAERIAGKGGRGRPTTAAELLRMQNGQFDPRLTRVENQMPLTTYVYLKSLGLVASGIPRLYRRETSYEVGGFLTFSPVNA